MPTAEQLLKELDAAGAPTAEELLAELGQQDPAQLPGLARSFGQGFFGLGDEVEAATMALAAERETGESLTQAYNRHLGHAREQLHAFREAYPGRALAAELVGSVALPGGAALGAARAVPAAGRALTALRSARTVGQAMRRGAAGGAAVGAAFGAGQGEGLEERAMMGAGGAMLGGVVGGAVPVVFSTGRALVNAVAPTRTARRELALALQRDFPDLSPMEAANRVVARLQSARKGNPEVMLADVAGENVRGFLRRAETVPGAGRQLVRARLDERQGRQLERIAFGLRQGTGVPRSRSREVITELMENRANVARPLYAEAYRSEMSEAARQRLARIEETPLGKRALARARSFMASEAQSPAGVGYRGQKWETIPPVARADALKRGLDGMAKAAKDPNEKRILAGLAREVRGIVDDDLIETTGKSVYAEARQAFEDPARYIDAIEEGAKAMKPAGSLDTINEAMLRMSASEKEAFRLGAVNELIETMRKDRASLADMTKYMRSIDMRDRISALMPTDAARREWRRLFTAEELATRSYRTIQGSRTAPLLAEKEAAERAASIWGMVIDLVTFGARDIITRKVPQMARKATDRLAARNTAEIADMVTRPGGMPAGLTQRASRGGAAAGTLGAGPASGGAQ